ncbi:MAG: hypothetical protein KDE14_00185 [Rhodobacteraceae bacterium]|nr:hypothetical protein [Paracoccaceae bacterium]
MAAGTSLKEQDPILRRAIAACAMLVFVCAYNPRAAQARLQPGQSLAFVLVSLRTAIYETKYFDECPAGIAIGNDEIWWKSLSPLDRDRLTDGGEKEPAARRVIAAVRGPRGEDVCWIPDVVTDPPLRTVGGNISYGRDLDGRSDGAATANSCAHRDFEGPNGEPGIDNQMYRLLGCVYGWRTAGYIEDVADTERRDSTKGVWLIEITPLDQSEPSQRVQVAFFRVVDGFRKALTGDILPYASYRIDQSPTFQYAATGTLTDGVLATDRMDIRLPFYGNRVSTDMIIRDMSLELKIDIDGSGADGLLTGYHDVDNWWDYVRKMGYLIETAQFSCPALYQAAHELADGYPDPETGACTALSAAYKVKMLPAFVDLAVARPEEGVSVPLPGAMASYALPSPPDALAGVAPDHPQVFTAAPGPAGPVLTDLDGRTLYTLERTAACGDSCMSKWKAVEAAWTAVPAGDWSIEAAPDRSRQWVFRGLPLFVCKDDAKPSVVTCEGDGWYAVRLAPPNERPPWVTRQDTMVGKIFGDQRGHTLYVLLGDRAVFERTICAPDCMKALWHPIAAEDGASPIGEWAPVETDTGRWWTYRGLTVHTYAGDQVPGQIAGHLFGGASVSAKNYWTAIPPEIADLASPRQVRAPVE